jgi:DtxR family Mn-dependent transcriptional regulator
MLSVTEENYLKSIYKIAEADGIPVSTNSVAARMQTTAASVTDMIKRLSEKDLLDYEKYRGVQLTKEGNRLATQLIRKHRLWEVFLTEQLGFRWDEVHDIAEELEHIQSTQLIDRLDRFLGHPRFDPHGDPIPDANGEWEHRQQIPLSALQPGQTGIVTGVNDHSPAFLQYLQQLGLTLGARVALQEIISYDQSLRVVIGSRPAQSLSEKVARNLNIHLSEK